MPLTLIETRAQVRTEFDEASLAELAGDIAARGVLQPILLRPNPGMVNFLLIAGERRFRAAKLAGLEAIPAIVGETDEDGAASMQIAENIQREDLSLADTTRQVRKMYELCGDSVTAAAEKLHKSKSWVSKHLAASCPSLRHFAREILEGGFSEDLEIILILDKLQEIDWYGCQQICQKIKTGDAGRQTVREAYEAAKRVAEERQAQLAEKNTPEAKAEREAAQKEQQEKWKRQQEEQAAARARDPRNICAIITTNAETEPDDREEISDEQKAILAEHLEKLHGHGKHSGNTYDALQKLIEMQYDQSYEPVELAAYFLGVQEVPFDLAMIIDQVNTAIGNVAE
jgi:ParB/RepB/Spo0J family partition protein